MRTPVALLAVAAMVCSACSGSDDAPDRPTVSSSVDATSDVSTTSPAPSSSARPTTTRSRAKRSRTKAVPSAPLQVLTVDGQDDSYVVQVWAQVRNRSCYDHAHGDPVVTYLTTNPCRGLNRLLATTVVDGRSVGFARSSFGFSGAAPAVYKTALRFRALVEKDDTGNVDDLMRDGYRLPDGPPAIPSSYAFSALSQDSAVTVLEAWYLDGSTPVNDPALLRMAHDLFRQF